MNAIVPANERSTFLQRLWHLSLAKKLTLVMMLGTFWMVARAVAYGFGVRDVLLLLI